MGVMASPGGRRTVPLAALLLAATLAAAAEKPAAGGCYESVVTAAADGQREAALDALAACIEAGEARPSRVLSEPAFGRIRRHPESRRRLREILGRAPRESRVTMVVADEPGDALWIDGAVADEERDPIPGAVLYLYHTDGEGLYAPESTGAGSGNDNPRLFAYVRTDSRGRFLVRTITPAPYPGIFTTRHVHVTIRAPGRDPVTTEILLDMEPPPSDETRRWAEGHGVPVVAPRPGADGSRITVLFTIPSP